MGDFRLAALQREYELCTAEGDTAAACRALEKSQDIREAAIRRERAYLRGELSVTGRNIAELFEDADRVFQRARADHNPGLMRKALDAMSEAARAPARFWKPTGRSRRESATLK